MNIRSAALLLAACLSSFASSVLAAADGSRLELPPKARAAIVIFEDLQCPDCAQAHPVLVATAEATRVPLVIHDFPITRHAWAFPAAVLAGYFTQMSPALGVEFRGYVFRHQKEIGPENLRSFAEQFAAEHHLVLPPIVDPDGKLKDKVQADFDFGTSIGLQYVPLIFVLTAGDGDPRWIEVTDTTKLEGVVRNALQGRAE